MENETNVTDNIYNGVDVMVCDALMGSGKTCAAINHIKASPPDEKILFVTPYLDQIERVKRECSNKNFVEPEIRKGHGKKLQHLKDMIREGENACLVTTHSLFHLFDEEIIGLLREQEYTLYLDEVTTVIEEYKDLSDEQDYTTFMEKYARLNEKGLITWRDEVDYNGKKYANEKRFCQFKSLARYTDNGKRICLWLFPMEIFTAFKKVYILTYMFEGQLQACYYKYFGLPYRYIYVTGDRPENFEFTDDENKKRVLDVDYSKLINICEDPKLNKIGGESPKDRYKLSLNWYRNNRYNGNLAKLKRNICNWFQHRGRAKVWQERLWTTFKDYKSKIKGNGYTNAFLSVNARATNDFASCTSVVYPVNIFVHPIYGNFFRKHGIEFNEDMYALSEMLQFIWRSAIRNGNPIDIYIPSIRMRTLLKVWIAENSIPSAKSA